MSGDDILVEKPRQSPLSLEKQVHRLPSWPLNPYIFAAARRMRSATFQSSKDESQPRWVCSGPALTILHIVLATARPEH